MAGNRSAVGGLVGSTTYEAFSGSSSVSDSYSDGSAIAESHSDVGGLIGSQIGVVKNPYSRSSVSGGQLSNVVGSFGSNTLFSNTKNSVLVVYDIGSVTGGEGSFIGGFVGKDTTLGAIRESYWDVDTTGVSDGAGNLDEGGMTGLTDEQFQSGLPDGFDPKIWTQSPKINNGYPYLIANPPEK